MTTGTKIKEYFNDLSFILLIIIWFFICTFITIDKQHHFIGEIILKEELELKSKTLDFFDWKMQTSTNILNFAKEIENEYDEVIIWNKSWKILYSCNKNELNEIHSAAISSNMFDIESTFKWGNILVNFTFKNWEKLTLSKGLSKEDKNSMWGHHLLILSLVILMISIIYLSYRTLFINRLLSNY